MTAPITLDTDQWETLVREHVIADFQERIDALHEEVEAEVAKRLAAVRVAITGEVPSEPPKRKRRSDAGKPRVKADEQPHAPTQQEREEMFDPEAPMGRLAIRDDHQVILSDDGEVIATGPALCPACHKPDCTRQLCTACGEKHALVGKTLCGKCQ